MLFLNGRARSIFGVDLVSQLTEVTEEGDRLALNLDCTQFGGLESIASIDELNDSEVGGPDTAIRRNMNVLSRFDDLVLQETRPCRVDGGIGETLTTTLGVEEELGGLESSHE